jgi:hypothetical protein
MGLMVDEVWSRNSMGGQSRGSFDEFQKVRFDSSMPLAA